MTGSHEVRGSIPLGSTISVPHASRAGLTPEFQSGKSANDTCGQMRQSDRERAMSKWLRS